MEIIIQEIQPSISITCSLGVAADLALAGGGIRA
jgi:hypothetical protein